MYHPTTGAERLCSAPRLTDEENKSQRAEGTSPRPHVSKTEAASITLLCCKRRASWAKGGGGALEENGGVEKDIPGQGTSRGKGGVV